MKPMKTLLTAALCLALTPAYAQNAQRPDCVFPPPVEVPQEAVEFTGPIHVMTQGEDGVIRCQAEPVADEAFQVIAEDGVEPLPWHVVATQSNNQFAFDLYAQLVEAGEAHDNLFFSPISITAALTLTYEGAAGNTQEQFEQLLHLGGVERAGYHAALAELLGELSGEDAPYDLTVANSLWGERTTPFRDTFLETLNTHYDAGFQAVDFIGDPEAQRDRINSWVEEQTNDKIVDLIPEGAIDNLTRLVLANAIYFNAAWQFPFNERLTENATFQIGPRNADISFPLPTEARMMLLPNQRLRYADLDGVDVLELPYEGRDLSMLIILPDDMNDFEPQLSADRLSYLVSQLDYAQVRVRIPSWEMRQSTNLNDPLQQLGLTDAFDFNRANFSRLTDSHNDFAITDAMHQAYIRVDEEGTEAAAATAIAIGARSLPPEPVDFTADSPFVYVIRHNETGTVLFIGRMFNPEAPQATE